MIKISLISFRWLKSENPLQFSFLRSSFPPRPLRPPPLITIIFLTSKDSPRGANRDGARNKRRETPGVQLRF